MGKVGNARCKPGSDIVCLEGNGARPSHQGIGFIESEVMYTLNATEVHAVAYGIEPGAAQRLDPSKRIWRECSPTLRAKAGDNQASVAICYGICSYHSNSMKSDNPYSGIYEADTSRTLDLNGGSPACQQGGVLILEMHISGESSE